MIRFSIDTALRLRALAMVCAAAMLMTGCVTVPPVPSPTPSPTPTVIAPCSPTMEQAYEIVRFARHSHEPWLEKALRDEIHDYALGDNDQADVLFQRWWLDNYEVVLDAIEQTCAPSADYPNLRDLPGTWETYPPRSASG